MSTTLGFFSDAGLAASLASLARSANSDGSSGAIDALIYIGSTAAGKIFKASSNPGVDQLTLTPVDSASGSGHPASEIKLALSSGGLSGATAGAPLNLGTQILSGVGNALPVYVRWTNTVSTTGVSTEISLVMNTVQET